MSGHIYTLNSVYHPTEGTGTVRIVFHDLRKSSLRNAQALLNAQITNIGKDRPANRVITARHLEGERFASIWSYALSTSTDPSKPSRPATRAKK